jgi:hypothetical protein
MIICQLIDIGQRLHRETRVWHSLSHENVMPFLGLCLDVGPSPAMISRLYNNGHVHQYLARNPQIDRLSIVSLGCLWRDDLINFLSPSDYWYCAWPPISPFEGGCPRRPQRSESLSYSWPSVMFWQSRIIFSAQHPHRWWRHTSVVWFWSFKINRSQRFYYCHICRIRQTDSTRAYHHWWIWWPRHIDSRGWHICFLDGSTRGKQSTIYLGPVF